MNTPQEFRTETAARTHSGALAVLLALLSLAAGAALVIAAVTLGPRALLPGMGLVLVGVLGLAGLYMQQPNEARILTLFGRYQGTDRQEGLRWANPLALKRKLSLRARNLNAPTLKVNDKRGNPVEISAAVVWRVEDTARAVFEVDDFEVYVRIQAEAAIRHLAARLAYDE